MKKVEFEFDYNSFKGVLARNSHGYKGAKKRFWETVEYWPRFAEEMLSPNAIVELDEENFKVVGEVLGKSFSLVSGVVADDTSSHVEAVLTVLRLGTQENVELGRFLFAPNGDVLSSDKEELLTWQDDYQSYKLFIAVLRKVLNAPMSV